MPGKLQKYYRVIIVGGGPAGLSAARHINGSCLVIDRKKAIGDHVRCGEAISAIALDREGLLGLANFVRTPIHRVLKQFADSNPIGTLYSEPSGFVIDRKSFEMELLKGCEADLLLETEVLSIIRKREPKGFELHTTEGTFGCDVLIGADGPASFVRSQVFGQKQSIIPAINYWVELENMPEASTLRIYLNNDIVPGGYSWLFPTGGNTANLGVLSRNVQLSRRHFNTLEEFCKQNVGKITQRYSKSGVIPTGGFMVEPHQDNCLVVGDAGGYVDPIFDGGLNLALLTGRFAANAVNQDRCVQYVEDLANHLPPYSELSWAKHWLFNLSNSELTRIGHKQMEEQLEASFARFQGIWRRWRHLLW